MSLLTSFLRKKPSRSSKNYNTDDKEIYERILNMTPKEAREKDVSRPTLWKIKQKIKDGKKINFKTKSVRKLNS